MNIIEAENFLLEALDGRVSKRDIKNAMDFLNNMQEILELDYLDLCHMCISCPTLITLGDNKVVYNLEKLADVCNIKSAEFKNLVLKSPYLLLLNADFFVHKIELISIAFGVSFKSALRYLYFYPEIIEISKRVLIKQIKMLSDELHEYGLALRKLFRQEPQLLFVSSEQLDLVKKYFMKSFGLSEPEIENVIKAVPSLAVQKLADIENKFNVYYPSLFIKRDIKEILEVCPEFVGLDANEVVKKINDIKDFFGINIKKACEFARKSPNILFYSSPVHKLNCLTKFKITKEYIKTFPHLLNMVEISLPIKFAITRILGLEQDFDQIAKTKLNSLLSKFLFMQKHGLYEHKDLLLKDDEFEAKYQVTVEKLKEIFKINEEMLINICKFYSEQREFIQDWSDIPFPPAKEFVSYANSAILSLDNFDFDNVMKNQVVATTRDRAIENLKLLNFSTTEAEMIINKNQFLSKIASMDMIKIVAILRNYGFEQDDIMQLLMNKSSLFVYPVVDFVKLLEEIADNENCNEKEAILKYM